MALRLALQSSDLLTLKGVAAPGNGLKKDGKGTSHRLGSEDDFN